jgi:hypothetical protein
MSEDLSHDPHLRAALRHAPDHALVPPSRLSATILSAARQAHRPARSAAAAAPVRMRAAGSRPLLVWLRRLASPRWASAMATGLVAALGFGLWLDLGIEPVVERPRVVVANTATPAAQSSADAASALTPSGDAVTTAGRVAAPSTERATDTSPPAPTAEGPPTAKAAALPPAVPADPRAAGRRGEPSAGAPGRRDKSNPLTAPARQDAVAPRAAAAPAVAQAPSSRVAEETTPASRLNDTGAVSAARSARKAEQSDAASEAAPAASPALTLLRRARAETATGSARWTWTAPGSTTMAPVDDAAQAWLLGVVQSARGRWADVTDRGDSLDATEVRWWRDGWPHATLRIEAEGLRWLEPSGRIRYAPLEAATLQRLRSF